MDAKELESRFAALGYSVRLWLAADNPEYVMLNGTKFDSPKDFSWVYSCLASKKGDQEAVRMLLGLLAKCQANNANPRAGIEVY
jgi:hypothetical protein